MNTAIARILDGFNADLPSGYEAAWVPEEEFDWTRLSVRCPDGWLLPGPAIGADTPSIEDFAGMLRNMQGELIEHVLGEAWPKCPDHGGHPLDPRADGWFCPTEDPGIPGVRPWPYGTLAAIPVPPDPPRADGKVRWYLEDLGWGVIAHHEGDLFVLFAMIEGTGYRMLHEGQQVEFTVSSGRQGKFRRAEHVRTVNRRKPPREHPTN